MPIQSCRWIGGEIGDASVFFQPRTLRLELNAWKSYEIDGGQTRQVSLQWRAYPCRPVIFVEVENPAEVFLLPGTEDVFRICDVPANEFAATRAQNPAFAGFELRQLVLSV